MHAPRSIVAFPAVLLVVALAGCSSSGRSPSDTPADQPLPATTTTAPTFSGEGSEPFCTRARAAQEQLNRLALAEPTRDAVREQFTTAADRVRGLAQVAPAEIDADVRVLVRTYDVMFEELREADWDPSRLATETADKLGQPDVRRATDRLQAYQATVCGMVE